MVWMWLLSQNAKAISLITLSHFCELPVSLCISPLKANKSETSININCWHVFGWGHHYQEMWPFGRLSIFITDPQQNFIRTMTLRVVAKKPHSYCPSVEKRELQFVPVPVITLCRAWLPSLTKRPEANCEVPTLKVLKLWSYVANTNP